LIPHEFVWEQPDSHEYVITFYSRLGNVPEEMQRIIFAARADYCVMRFSSWRISLFSAVSTYGMEKVVVRDVVAKTAGQDFEGMER
jgi:hypothetical protein